MQRSEQGPHHGRLTGNDANSLFQLLALCPDVGDQNFYPVGLIGRGERDVSEDDHLGRDSAFGDPGPKIKITFGER